MTTVNNQWKLESSKNYATQENAVKAAETVLSKFHSVDPNANPKYMIGVNDSGRFLPVFFNARCDAFWFAHQGFSVVG